MAYLVNIADIRNTSPLLFLTLSLCWSHTQCGIAVLVSGTLQACRPCSSTANCLLTVTLCILLHTRAISPHYIQATRRRFVTHHGKLPWIRVLCIAHVAAAAAAVVQVVLMALVATFGGSSSPPTGWPTAIFLIPPAAFIRCVGLITSRGGSTINPGTCTVQNRHCFSSMMAPLTPLACWRAVGRIRAGVRPWLHGPCWDAASSAWHVCVCDPVCVYGCDGTLVVDAHNVLYLVVT